MGALMVCCPATGCSSGSSSIRRPSIRRPTSSRPSTAARAPPSIRGRRPMHGSRRPSSSRRRERERLPAFRPARRIRTRRATVHRHRRGARRWNGECRSLRDRSPACGSRTMRANEKGQERQARPLVVGCSTETGSDAGKVSLRASSSASSWRLRLSLSPSS
jgi:hypothetical protein